jgi:thioredoxin reductase (NADPH)
VTESIDVVIVGAGPTGLSCAIELKRQGVSALLVEKGCLCNSLYHYPTHMTFFTTPELLEIGDIPMTSLGEKPTRTEALKYYRRVTEHYQLDVRLYESVDSITGTDGAFTVTSLHNRTGQTHTYHCRKIILASGFYDRPNLLGVPGEDLDKVIHYYKEPHPFWNHDVAVVGAKNSAAIAALELFWTGARVTLIHRGDKLSDSIKYWIKPNIENRIKNGEVKAYFNSSVREVLPAAIVLDTPAGEVTLKNDFVLAMTGYRPDVEFLARLGITLDPKTRRPYTDPETLESTTPGIYLAGVVVAGMHTNEIFIENGRFHGKSIAGAMQRDLARA